MESKEIIEVRLEKARRAAETVKKMQRLLRQMKERSHELVRDPLLESSELYEAIKHADDALQILRVHLHYLSVREPNEE